MPTGSTSRRLQLLAAALLTTAAALAISAGPAAAQPVEPTPPPPVVVHSAGPVPDHGLLSPGSTVAWPLRVEVGVAWRAELSLSIRASGQLAEADPGVVVSVRECSTQWSARSCPGTVRTIASDLAGSELVGAEGVPIGRIEVGPESYLLVEITAVDTQTLPQSATGEFVLGIVARELVAPDPGATPPPGPPAPEVTVPLQPGAAASSPSPAPALAFTGASLLVMLLLAAVGVGVGVLLVRASERRRAAVRASAVIAIASVSVAVLALGHLSTTTDASWSDEVHAGATFSVPDAEPEP